MSIYNQSGHGWTSRKIATGGPAKPHYSSGFVNFTNNVSGQDLLKWEEKWLFMQRQKSHILNKNANGISAHY